MASPKNRKRFKKKYRLRKGRIAVATIILVVIIALIITLIQKCSSLDTASIDSRHIPVAEAIKCGREDAIRVLQTVPGTMARHNAILYIKSRESKLRLSGYNHAADDYIDAVTDYLEKHKPLYKE